MSCLGVSFYHHSGNPSNSLENSKSNRLEIYKQSSDGLHLFYSRSLYGKVIMLERVRSESSKTDHLFIGTDRYLYFTVSWDPQSSKLRTEQTYVDQADKTSRDSQTQDKCIIDPNHNFMALLLFDGIVTILPISQQFKKKLPLVSGALGEPVPARISDLFIRSCTFLYIRQKDREKYQLAFLYEDSHQKVCLSVRALDYSVGGSGDPGSADLDKVLAVRNDLELGSSHLIPVPLPACKCFAEGQYVFDLLCSQTACLFLPKLQSVTCKLSLARYYQSN